jgi:DNA (cytosine-5)-methyltransferase 1
VRVVSTFAGIGGSSFGYEQAGLEVAGAVEFQPDIAEAYRLNHPAPVLVADVRELSGRDLVAEFGSFDVLDGSPPCQAFSRLNTRSRRKYQEMEHGDGSRQRSDDLAPEWARLVAEARPRLAVMENVAALAEANHRAWLLPAVGRLRAAGYHLALQVLRAERLGTPSTRRRLILVASLDGPPRLSWPSLPPVPAAVAFPPEAEGLIAKDGVERAFQWRSLRRPSPAVSAQSFGFGGRNESAVVVDDGLERDPWTGCLLQPTRGRWLTELRAAARHRPIRFIASSEAAALMGFPELQWAPGTTRSRAWAMVGNSVPPPLSRAVGRAIVEACG